MRRKLVVLLCTMAVASIAVLSAAGAVGAAQPEKHRPPAYTLIDPVGMTTPFGSTVIIRTGPTPRPI